MRKQLLIIGTITYFILLILSLVYYLERTALFDAAFNLFTMAKDSSWAIDQRYIKILPQIPAVVAIKAGLSLETVAKLYSVSFVLIQYGIFVFLIRWLKSNTYALVLLLFSVLMVTELFYWMVSEYRMGIWLCILYFGILSKYPFTPSRSNKLIVICAALLLLFFITSSYLLILIPFMYFTLFLWLHHHPSKPLLGISTLLFAAFFTIRYYFFTSNYEYQRTGTWDKYTSGLSDFFELPSTLNFWDFLISDYYLLIVFGLAAVIFYIWKRSLGKLILLIGAFALNLILVNINWSWGADQFYLENPYLSLSLIVVLPFAFDIAKKLSTQSTIIVVSLIMIIRLVHIADTHEFYSERVSWLRDFMHSTNSLEQKKLLVNESVVPMDSLLLTWATPFEFWLVSTIEMEETRSILIMDNAHKKEAVLSEKKKFFILPKEIPYHELPERYFKLKDTSRYRIMDSDLD